MKFNARFDAKSCLEQAMAAKEGVEVYLCGGQTLAGKVAEVGDHHVVMTELVGKEFYDAHVRLEDVSAVVARRSK